MLHIRDLTQQKSMNFRTIGKFGSMTSSQAALTADAGLALTAWTKTSAAFMECNGEMWFDTRLCRLLQLNDLTLKQQKHSN